MYGATTSNSDDGGDDAYWVCDEYMHLAFRIHVIVAFEERWWSAWYTTDGPPILTRTHAAQSPLPTVASHVCFLNVLNHCSGSVQAFRKLFWKRDFMMDCMHCAIPHLYTTDERGFEANTESSEMSDGLVRRLHAPLQQFCLWVHGCLFMNILKPLRGPFPSWKGEL